MSTTDHAPCPACGGSLPEKAMDCPACGATVRKACPFCAEPILVAATKCKHCRTDLAARERAAPAAPPASSAYGLVADKVGFLPNVRWKDNLFQLAFVLLAMIAGAAIGFAAADVRERIPMMLGGALAGLLGGVLLSGFVLGLVGLVRKS